jgi:hypothetical protein
LSCCVIISLAWLHAPGVYLVDRCLQRNQTVPFTYVLWVECR